MQESQPNYFVWTIVLTIGFAAGNLLATLIKLIIGFLMLAITTVSFTNSWNAKEPTSSPGDQRRAHYQQQENKSQAKREQQDLTVKIQNERANTKRGQQLLHVCNEWKANAVRNESATITTQANYHCQRYQKFIQTGQ